MQAFLGRWFTSSMTKDSTSLLTSRRSIPFKHVDGGVRDLLVLLLCILEDGNLNLAENAEIKLAAQVVLAVL